MEIVSKSYLLLYGITATTIMMRGLRHIGATVDYYIPERLIDGYGMNIHSCEEIADAGYTLVITVDCGVTGFDEVNYFNSRGVDVVVTDHHKTKDTLPNAYAVIDNQRQDNTYPFPDICGAMVAFKVINALYTELGISGEEDYLKMFAAIGTVTDVMPLISENRTIVKEGLRMIAETELPNIEYLLKAAGKSKNTLTAMDIGFYIGPLINASSRIGSVHDAMNVFISDDQKVIEESSKKLISYNEKRKAVEKEITTGAMDYVMTNGINNGVVIACGEGWHKGVIGIACSRLVDKFFRPAIVLSLVDGKYTGSCRSVEGINIMDILDYAKDYILGYGGHVGAAGLSVAPENIDLFIEKVNEYSDKFLADFDFHPISEIEMEIFFNEISLQSFDETRLIEPFGTSTNPEPIFVCKDMVIKEIKKIGKTDPKEHLSMTLTGKNSNIQIKAIGFFMADYFSVLDIGDIVSISFKLNKNEFLGKTNIQLMIDDIFFNKKIDGTYNEFEVECSGNPYGFIKKYGSININNNEYIEIFKAIYELIKKDKYNVVVADKTFLKNVISSNISKEISFAKLMFIIKALSEANLLNVSDLGYDNVGVSLQNDKSKRIKISETRAFKENN